METSRIETLSSAYPYLSNYVLREIPARILRLRRVAHQPARAWAMVQLRTKSDQSRTYWRELKETDFKEYVRKLDEHNMTVIDKIANDDRDWSKERRIQKSKKYTCKSQTV